MYKSRTKLSGTKKSNNWTIAIGGTFLILLIFIVMLPTIYVWMIDLNEGGQIELSSEFPINPDFLVANVNEDYIGAYDPIITNNIVRVELRYLCEVSSCEFDNLRVFTEIVPKIRPWFTEMAKYNSYSLDPQSGNFYVMTYPYNRQPNPEQLCLDLSFFDEQIDSLVSDVVSQTENVIVSDDTQFYVLKLIWDGYFKPENCYWSIQTDNGLHNYKVDFHELDF